MARKVAKPKAEIARPDKGRDDLSVLYPDVTLPIAGRDVTVREYGFIEGLQLRPKMAPMIADLDRLFTTGEALVEDILDMLGNHVDLVRLAIAQSTRTDVDWVGGLNDADGDLLVNTWWGVCGPFFMRQVLRRHMDRAERRRLAGAASSPSSSTAASAPSPSSAAAPSGSSSSSTTS